MRVRDLHVHSNYSDGAALAEMIDAAEDAGLDGVGFADHCIVSERTSIRDARAEVGFNFDRTVDRRRRAIDRLRPGTEVDVYDAVEMDYHPDDEAAVAEFLDDADFDYALGSVHRIDGVNVQRDDKWADRSDAAATDVVDRYVDALVSLVESELFEVAAHVDLLERTPTFNGRLTDDHYERVTRAFADSRTVPEVNAGRALTDAELVHPAAGLFESLRDHGVRFTLGSDAHTPAEVRERSGFLAEFAADRGVDPVAPDELVG